MQSGYSHIAPVIFMGRYLAFLYATLQDAGVCFHRHEISTAAEALSLLPPSVRPRAHCTVCCLGLGAQQVVGDNTMRPDRGHLLFVRCPGQEAVLNDEDPTLAPGELTYIVPQDDGILALAGSSEPGNPSEDPNPAQELATLRRCQDLLPALRGSTILGSWSGLRPFRQDGVRLGREAITEANSGVPLIYNYGHGGSGVVVSWACAAEVSRLAGVVAEEAGVRGRLRPKRATHLLPPRPPGARL